MCRCNQQSESEAEQEAEQFFGQLARLAQRAGRSPALQRIARDAARSALQSVGGVFGGLFEGEGESEAEAFARPSRSLSEIDAILEHLGHMAANAESEQEAAEAFLPLIPLVASTLLPLAAKALPKVAAKIAPRAAQTLMRNAPQLGRAVGGLTRSLYNRPGGRQLVRTVPTIVRRTAADITRQVAQGRPVPPQAAVQALAKQASAVIGSPQQAIKALQRARSLDGQYHQTRPAAVPAAPAASNGHAGTCPTCGQPAAAAPPVDDGWDFPVDDSSLGDEPVGALSDDSDFF